MALSAVRGAFFDFTDDPWRHPGREGEAARFHADGLLVVEDGRIVAFGAYADLAPAHSHLPLTHICDRIIVPGFIDGHIHFPQARIMGAFGEQLLPWLNKWVLPEERKYKDPAYAQEGARRFFDVLLASGTTTCQAFTTTAPAATEAFFEEAARRRMRVIAGLTGADILMPDDYVDTAENFYRDSKDLIARYHRVGRNLYAITPRFALSSSPAMLELCERLKREHPDCWVNTHISENPAEIRAVRGAFPDCPDYLAVYEKYGLVGPKFTGGHGVWLSDGEFRRLSRSGGAVAFCPCSNLFLGSGLFRLGRATDPAHRVRLSFGSDVGGGNRFSMLSALEDAYKVGMCNATLLDGSVDPSRADAEEAERNKLSPYRGFWSLTLGGAEALYIDDLVGNFEPGKEADFVALDWQAGPAALAWRQSLVAPNGPQTMEEAADLLFGIMMAGEESCVAETWVLGERAYQRR